MSEFLRNITVKVVGVTFENEDGSSRQKNISRLKHNQQITLKYYEYEGEPAYAVYSVYGQCIGNLPKDLAHDIYKKYKDCFLDTYVVEVVGGFDDLSYGCVIGIDIYDDEPEIKKGTPLYSDQTYKISGIFLSIISVLLILIGILLLLASPISGIITIAFGFIFFIAGKQFRNVSKKKSS